MNDIELFKDELISILGKCNKITGIGQTGDINAPLIPGNSDVDLFVLCTSIPSKQEREEFYSNIQKVAFSLQMEVCQGGQWGYGDIMSVDGIDVMPMYFTWQEMSDYLNEILACKHLDKDGRFYPVGRVASVASMNVLYETDDSWTSLIQRVNRKPDEFFKTWYENEMNQVIDEEDLGRSMLRKEVLFFHQVLENALDHWLQALYAVNYCYFPSRKRTEEAMRGFQFVPKDGYNRLNSIIVKSAKSETICEGIEELRAITKELKELGKTIFEEEKRG